MSWPPIICVNAECVYIYIVVIFPVRSIGLHAYIISCAFVYIPVRSNCMREYVHKVQCVTIFPVRPVRFSAVLSLTRVENELKPIELLITDVEIKRVAVV